jgi:hypothetical protein
VPKTPMTCMEPFTLMMSGASTKKLQTLVNPSSDHTHSDSASQNMCRQRRMTHNFYSLSHLPLK